MSSRQTGGEPFTSQSASAPDDLRMVDGAVNAPEHTVKLSFGHRLLSTARDLFESEKLSDLAVILDGRKVPCHRFVFVARSDYWTINNMANSSTIEFGGISYEVGTILLKWMYRDEVDPKLGDTVLLELMHAARRFELYQLIQRCECLLISKLDVDRCVQFYKCAMELHATKLMDASSQYIVSYWTKIPLKSFDHLDGTVLHNLLESKFKSPLHAAISLRREDVVRLCIREHGDQLKARLTEHNENNELPLQLALKLGQEAMAQCLVDSGASVNATNVYGVPILLDFLKQCDYKSCNFLAANSAGTDCVDPTDGRNGLHTLASSGGQLLPPDSSAYVELLGRFLAGGSVPYNQTDQEGNTALHMAVINTNMVFFDNVVNLAQVDTEILNKEGFPPLWYALNHSEDGFPYAERLIKRGANFNSIRPKTGDTLLCMCVKTGLTKAALYLIDQGASVDVANTEGETALYLACKEGISCLVSALLNRGANPNVQRKKDNDTPLLVAIRQRHHDAVEALLHGCKEGSHRLPLLFDVANCKRENAMSLAISIGQYDVADKLITAGCTADSKTTDGDPLLSMFIESENLEACMYLLRHKCSCNARNRNGEAPLIQAVQKHLTRLVEALCEVGVDLTVTNADGDDALWTALKLQYEDVAHALVRSGMDVDTWTPGPGGCLQTLLHKAIDENNQHAACFLIQSRCNVNAIRKEGLSGEGWNEAMEKQTPLHMAASWGQSEVVAALIYYGAEINAQDSEGKTPLHLAVINQHVEITERLLQSPQTDMMIRDKSGRTPFAYAVQAKANRICDLILRRNPQVALQVDNKGYNVMHNAIAQEDYDLFCFLLSVSVDVNVRTQDSNRLSPLHIACLHGNELIVRNLLLAGSRVNDTNSNKETALHIAARHDHASICSILLANHLDGSAVDAEKNNALHIAVLYGSLSCVEPLLLESSIDPFSVNGKGQTILHLLGINGKENAPQILETIMRLYPAYPIDVADPEGNTILLLAYTRGNYELCRTAVKYDACVGISNRQGLSIFNYPSPSPKLLYHLLDALTKEPRWAEGDACSECGAKFSITTRKHHCRHCGRLLCTKCSEHSLPILKYDTQKAVRVCDVCFDVLKQYMP